MEKTLGEDEESNEEDLDWDDDQRIRNMIRALQQSTPGSLRRRQIASILQTRLRESEERARDDQIYERGRDSLVARGLPRAHADLLPKNISDLLPTQLKNDLDVLRQKSIEEKKETRKLKARQVLEGRWLRKTEKELHESVEKSHQTRDPYLRVNLKAYVEVFSNKLKLHHQSLGTYNTAEAIEERRRAGVDLGPWNSPSARPALGEMCS